MLANHTTWARPSIIQPLRGLNIDRPASPPSASSVIVWTQAQPVGEGSLLQNDLVGIAISKTWKEREQDLARMRVFEQNWDGFDAVAPDFALLDKADFFLSVLKARYPEYPPMRALLSADGSVAFEWASDDKFVQAEIIDPYRVEWMIATPGQETEFSIEHLDAQTQEQAWQPKPTVVDELVYASAL
jgi:hypothetical protein